MESFICKVMTPQGQIVKIKVEEKDKISCLKKLKRNNMTPISIEKTSANFIKNKQSKPTATIYSKKKRKLIKDTIDFSSKKVEKIEVKEFSEDLLILLKSDFSINHALITIINKTENTYFKDVLRNILKQHENGIYLYKTMKEYDDIFPLVYINLIKTGELTNSLKENLKGAIIYLEDDEKIRSKLQNELLPNVVFFIGIIIALMISIFIGIPALQRMLESFGKNIHIPQILNITFSIFKIILRYWYIVIAIAAILIYFVIKSFKTNDRKMKTDLFKYNNFLFGRLFALIDFSRIVKCISMNLKGKMRIQDTLEISKSLINNYYMEGLIEKSINDVYLGKSWIDAFENGKIVSPMIIEILKKSYNKKSLNLIETAIDYLDIEIEKELKRAIDNMEKISYVIIVISLLLFGIFVLIPCIELFMGGFIFI